MTKQPIRLTGVAPKKVGQLQLTWDDNVTRDVDVSKWMQEHERRVGLIDDVQFRQVVLVNGGGGVQWPNGLDFCAQTLRMRADEQLAAKGTF